MADEELKDGITETPPDDSVRASLEAAWDEGTKSPDANTTDSTVAAAGADAQGAAPTATDTTAANAATGVVDTAPAALTATAKAGWATLPAEWKAEVTRLTSDAAKAAGKYGDDAKYASQIRNVFEPYRPLMRQFNADEGATIASALKSISVLATGTPEQKAAEVAEIARAYGVDLTKVGSVEPPNPQLQPLMQEIGQLREQLGGLTSAQQEMYAQAANTDIQQFLASGDRPHFELVRGHMAQLMANKMAMTLADAYEQAVMLVPEAREAYLNTEMESRRAKAVEDANRARNAAASQRGKPLSGSLANREEPDSVRASLDKAWDELTS